MGCGCGGGGNGGSTGKPGTWIDPEAVFASAAPLVPDGAAPSSPPAVRGMGRREVPWWIWVLGAVVLWKLMER